MIRKLLFVRGAGLPAAMVVALLFGGATPATAQLDKVLKPVSLSKAEELAKACVGLTHGLDNAEQRLISGGWSKGTMSGGASELRIFARDGAMLMLTPAPAPAVGRSTCMEMMKLDKPTSGDLLFPAMDRAFGVKAVKASSGQLFWITKGEFASVTGDSADAVTGFRIIVGPNEEEGNK